MPIYATRCQHCGARQDVYRALKDYEDMPLCCGEKVQRVPCAAFVQADIQPYQSMVTGEMIHSRSQHRAHLKQHGKIELGNEKPVTVPTQTTDDSLKKELHHVFSNYGH